MSSTTFGHRETALPLTNTSNGSGSHKKEKLSNMFRAYGKVNEADQARLLARRKTRRRIAIIGLSFIVLAAIVVAAVFGSRGSGGDSKNGGNGGVQPISSSIKAVCDVTLYKDTCYDSLAPMANSSQLQPEDIFKLSMKVAIAELSKASQYFSKNGIFKDVADKMSIAALENCGELLSLAIDHLNSSLSSSGEVSVIQAVDDLRTWLSSASTYQQTCIDAFEELKGDTKASVHDHLKYSSELTSNSLAIITWISKVASVLNLRRLMSSSPNHEEPEWFHVKDRKLLQSSDLLKKKADIIVAKDGSGKYKTISAALKAVPDKSKKRIVIYVKKGVYSENVSVEKKKWNVTMIGDGMESTVVSGSLNYVDGTPTFSTATFAVFGKGFVARDIGFVNTAGPQKHQAVALMSTADQSVFYRCRFEAFQDTLYAHSNRQFYRECNIIGTVDFIFGNSAVVFQNCNILPRQPLPNQQNTITAQGKVDPNQNTGIAIQNCTILPYGKLDTSLRTYLGRPWKNYSTTILMHSSLGSVIHPTGWLPWSGTTAPDTIFYSEYKNTGPGSSTKDRVKWKGLRSITDKEAKKFTVKEFLHGDKWISDTGVSYKSSL
ncbi:Root hair specific 12 [Theobroma cacao]|uniref:Pectinesterase n=1 Tax=Theobroma cacao TaxID=3641 RepID=A0A061FYJ8_THECC|nr:Root hair specific 12 [Theobroma cacao]